ncbi:hypothetical protein [Granulicella sp. L60]|uniref:hypothetical protein n=1 Tax=Granulicella sp. L60 TaxID=1641866 RepID=UPI00131BC775|nr:hypothetical protein [Granulicella sp. L60]
MTLTSSHDELEYYHLLLLGSKTQIALLEEAGGESRLPRIGIPRYTRPAEQITALVFEKWRLRAIVIDWLSGHKGSPYCAVLEIFEPVPFPCDGLSSVPIAEVPRHVLPKESLTMLEGMVEGNPGERGPFSRLGWIEDAKNWIRESANDQGLEFTDIRQLNAGGSFALARLDTRCGRVYWLKAVGDPNLREFATTSYLAKHCPQYLPRILSLREDWHAWIMEEFGSSLHSSESFADFELAAVRLAALQIQFIGKDEELLAAQFVDHRMPTVDGHIDELIAYLEEAMALQTSTRVPALSKTRLLEIGVLLHRACSAMQELAIPDSVMHSDISPGSILGDGVNCVFTDWCEAYLGNPFIALEQLCVHVSRKTTVPDTWRARLTSAYRYCWRDVLTEKQIEGALRLVPLVSVLSYLYGRGDWLYSPRRQDPGVQGYTRSLARHLDRIAISSGQQEALCQSA